MLDTGVQAGSASDDLGAAIGSMMGELESGSAPDESGSGTEAGAPPADAPLTDPQSEPSPDATLDGERPLEGDAPVPAAADAPPVAEDLDPLASATPLKYTVNGQERTIDGIKVLGDEAIITKEALPDVIRRLGERDNLYEQNQWAHRQQREYDAATAWKVTGEDGTERLVTGIPAITEMRLTHARNEAALSTLISALQNPEELRQMVALDDQDQLVLNPAFVSTLLTRSELAEIKAEQQTRALIGQLAQAAQPAPPAPDFKQYAPAIIKQAAGDQFATLSPKDQATLGQQMLRYVRPTTPAERQQGHGAHIVDAEFAALVQEWVGLRSEGAKAATVASSATASNAARIAAARQGAPARPGTKPTAPARPTTTRVSDANAAWEMREKAALAGLRNR